MTTFQTIPDRTQLTGVLSGTGHDMLRATAYTSSIPAHAPTQLADDIHPVYDSHGDLQDWRLGSLLPDHPVDHAAHTRFRTWRSGFAQDRFLGERALIRAVLDWLGPRCDISALGVLRLASGQVDFHTALKMKIQIEAADRVVAAAHEDGIGLYFQHGARNAMRALVPGPSETLLLGLQGTTLTLSTNGVHLQSPDPQSAIRALTSWRATEDGVVAAGDGREVLTDPDAATLLRIAGRQAPHINVHPAPLATLLAPLLVFLRDATTLAGNTGVDLHFRSGWS